MSESPHPVPIPMPTSGVDPRTALATAMHAAPGVYAVLVGSGMSSAAGIPTGWQVVEDLVRTIARSEGVELDVHDRTPSEWWGAQGRPNLRYDTLLSALASTDAARQALLRRYFDTRIVEGGPIEPTPAHDALAQLCSSGRIRLIVTTNFDRLVERALDRRGVSPQVVASPAAVRGMIPLTHAPVTVLKLHGDYATAGLRNTPEELASYPPEWEELLARIFDEFGLLVVGWSADYDVALASALSSVPSRRYPAFWTSVHGHLRESARRLIAVRQATVIDTEGANEFFEDLQTRVERLDRIAARRARPAALRTYRHMLDVGSALRGWRAAPLLQLRATAEIGPASNQETGIIAPEHRDRIREALSKAPLASRLRSLARYPPASALADAEIAPPDALTDWEPAPGGFQTTENATYRLGGDATRGVSALATVTLPSRPIGAVVLVTIDVGISIVNRLSLIDAALVLRDALVAATTWLPEAFEEILPAEAEITEAEIHLMASPNDGQNESRANALLDRVDLAQLGMPSRDLGQSIGSAARVNGPLRESDAADMVVDAIELMALANGFLDPRAGLVKLRADLDGLGS